MAWRVVWHVRCEVCDRLGPADLRSNTAEAKALKKGWLKGMAHGCMALHLCPACAAVGLPDWWPKNERTKDE